MAAHIFTVNETTFKTHLKYMFAGTGKDGESHQNGALADISGVRKGDYIAFYVMNKGFYGFFKASSNPFYEKNINQYLDNELNHKTLTYRVLIEPYKVFENPKSEWDVMENPKYIKEYSIHNMQWSWIFKKLNANRGCLAIDNHEFELLRDIISSNNIEVSKSKNYDYENNKIEINNTHLIYEGSIDLILKVNINSVRVEEDLKTMFTYYGNDNNILNEVLKPEENGLINFISNEVICSFSERRLDLVLGTDKDKCLLIELKNHFVFDNTIYNQIMEYSRWVSAYKLQYKSIIPIIIIREARIMSKRKNAIYFKYLSNDDKTKNKISDWYSGILDQIKLAKIKLLNENIERLEDLEIYIFETAANNELLKINALIL